MILGDPTLHVSRAHPLVWHTQQVPRYSCMNESACKPSWALPAQSHIQHNLLSGEHGQLADCSVFHLERLATLPLAARHPPGRRDQIEAVTIGHRSPVCFSPPPFQADLEDMTDLIEMREEMSNLVISAMKEAEEYQDSFERYSYLWMDDPQEFMKNFLIYGRAVTPEDLDTRAEETLSKTPPSLTQFQQQVRVPASSSLQFLPPPQGAGAAHMA